MIVLCIAGPPDQPLIAFWERQPHVRAASGDDDPSDWREELERRMFGSDDGLGHRLERRTWEAPDQ